MTKPRVLLTLPDVPAPADTGKRMRCAAVMAGLAGIADLDVLVVSDAPLPASGAPDPHRTDVVIGPLPRPRAVATAVRRALPWRIAAHDWTPATQAASRGRYDLVWFGYADHAVAFGGSVAADRTVVDLDDVESAKLAGFLASGAGDAAERWQRRVERPLWARLERRLLAACDRVVVCSEVDVDRLGSSRVRVVVNGYPDPGEPGPPAADPVLTLVANYDYEPNLDAARFLVSHVWPGVRQAVPGARLRLVGRHGETRLAPMAAEPGVQVVGTVPEVGAELRAARATVVPLRYGGGTRLKILESFAYGVPVASTAIGCEGLAVTPGLDILVADDPGELTRACVSLLCDPARAAAVGAAGRALYERRYRVEATVAAAAAVASELLDAP